MAVKDQVKKDLNKSASEIKAKAEKAGEKMEQKSAEIKKAVEEKSTELKKATEEKAAEVKKAVKNAKKSVAVKKDMKVDITIQHMGKEVGEKEIIANVKKAWTKTGKKVGDIKTMELYIKPEDSAVYYVINGTETGKVEF